MTRSKGTPVGSPSVSYASLRPLASTVFTDSVMAMGGVPSLCLRACCLPGSVRIDYPRRLVAGAGNRVSLEQLDLDHQAQFLAHRTNALFASTVACGSVLSGDLDADQQRPVAAVRPYHLVL